MPSPPLPSRAPRSSVPPRAGRPGVGLPALLIAVLLGGCFGNSPDDLMAKGQAALDKGSAAEAVLHFKSAVQASQDATRPRVLLARALLAAGDPGGAALELTKALELGHDRNEAVPLLARALVQSGQARRLIAQHATTELTDRKAQAELKTRLAEAALDQRNPAAAKAALEAALAAQPDHTSALLLQAGNLLESGNDAEAGRIVDRVIARDGRSAEAWLLRGEILGQARNDVEGGRAALRKALELDARLMPAHSALIGSYIRQRDMDEALKQLAVLRTLYPNHPQTQFIDAYLALVRKDGPTARDRIQSVLRVLPDNANVLELGGAIELYHGSTVMAETHFGKALRMNPALEGARRGLAKAQLQLGRAPRAWETLRPLVGPDSKDALALATAGEAALALGDLRAAEALFARAAGAAPQDIRARTSLAVTQLQRGEAAPALARLEALSVESTETIPDLALMSAQLKRGDFDAALRTVEAIAKKQPGSANPHELRGRVHMLAGDHTAARAAFDRAVQIDPALLTAVVSLAEIDLRAGQRDAARTRMETFVAAQPANSAAHVALADVLQRIGAPIEAVRKPLVEAIRLAPSDVTTHVRLVDANLRAKQFKEALSAAQAGDAAVPNDPTMLDALGRAQALAGDMQQSMGTFRRITNLETHTAQPHLRLAAMHRDQGNLTAASASLRRAIEIEPGNGQARADLIDLLVKSKQGRDAVQIARDMQSREPENAAGYLLEGGTLTRLNDLPGAIEAYRRGVKGAKDAREPARQLYRSLIAAGKTAEADSFASGWIKGNDDDAAMHYEIGAVAIARRNLDRAEQHLRRTVTLQSDHPVALNNLAWVLAYQGKPGAVSFARRAVDLLPNQSSLLDTLALALVSEKQFAEALKVQKQAVDIAPAEMGLRLGLARIAVRAGDKELARAELDRLAKLGNRFPLQDEVARLQKQL